MRRETPSMVHGGTRKAALYGTLATTRRLDRAPRIQRTLRIKPSLSLREYYITAEREAAPQKRLGWRRKRRRSAVVEMD
jgi:hypothetical protein